MSSHRDDFRPRPRESRIQSSEGRLLVFEDQKMLSSLSNSLSVDDIRKS